MPKDFDIVWNDKVIIGLTENEVKAGISRATLSLLRDAKLSIGKKGGLIRKTKKGRQVRQPSIPGKPPHRQTGQLVSSVGHEFEQGGLVGIVGTNVKHGFWLEFGTTKMAARPWLRPAFDRMVKKALTFFRRDAF